MNFLLKEKMETLKSFHTNLIVYSCFSVIACFNVDTDVPILKQGNSDSFFGYSVAQHLQGTEHKLLIGAPRDNITYINDNGREFDREIYNIERPGAVYVCRVSSDIDDCQLVSIFTSAPEDDEHRDDQWLGVSVSSQGTSDGSAAVCSHRLRLGTHNRLGQGICVGLSNGLYENQVYTPCQDKSTFGGHATYGLCQSGTSMDVGKNGEILVGMPGTYNWRGSVGQNTLIASFEGFNWAFSPTEDNSPVPPTVEFYSYMGMSSLVADIWQGQSTYVGGAPRSGGVGEVLLYVNDGSVVQPWMTLMSTLAGEQFGSGFGYSTTSGDFNGDGLIDLVVGAPFFQSGADDELDFGGAAYVYTNTEQGIPSDAEFIRLTERMSPSKCKLINCFDSRFGNSVASLGDLDRDGFEDLAVGAPYQGEGAVYIYRGSADGIIAKHSQQILPELLQVSQLRVSLPMETFGYSISGGNDMDNNGYPDILVGSYKSDQVTILRSRPVIKVEAYMISDPIKIDPEQTRCESDGRANNCFQITVGFKFTAQPTDQFRSRVLINYEIIAEKFEGTTISRVFFRGVPQESNHIVTGQVNMYPQADDRYATDDNVVYIFSHNKDFLHPVGFLLTYSFVEDPLPTMYPGNSIPDINSYPVLNAQDSSVKLLVPFIKNCGPDNQCHSDLVLRGEIKLDEQDPATGLPLLQIGQVDSLNINVEITNTQEDAHGTTFKCVLPPGIYYSNVVSNVPGTTYTCSPLENEVFCNIDNPLRSQSYARLSLELTVDSNLDMSNPLMDFALSTNTTSQDVDFGNNMLTLRMKAILKADLQLRGYSQPQETFYGGILRGETAMENEEQIGPNVIHTYEVVNHGPSPVSASSLTIWWPYETVAYGPNGKHLLYMMEDPEVEHPGVCTMDRSYINPANISVEELSTLSLAIPVVSESLSTERRKRSSANDRIQVNTERATGSVDGKGKKYIILSCNQDVRTARCLRIHCEMGHINSGESKVVRIRGRLWNTTLVEDHSDQNYVNIVSYGDIYIDPNLNIHQPNVKNDDEQITTQSVNFIKKDDARGIPLWVIILAVICGLILLIIIIVVLWKCGFFKRRHASDMVSHKGKVEKHKQKGYDDDHY